MYQILHYFSYNIYLRADETKLPSETSTTASPTNASDVNVLCYHGDGFGYRGFQNTTVSNRSCADWALQTQNFGIVFVMFIN